MIFMLLQASLLIGSRKGKQGIQYKKPYYDTTNTDALCV